MATAKGGITITGTIDGTSVLGEIAVVNGPLTQYYDGATVTPDWAAMWGGGTGTQKDQVPILYPKLHDASTGADLTGTVSISSVTYDSTANGVDDGTAITWGNDGVATAPSFVAGKLLKTTMTYGTGTIECVKIIGNLADGSLNPDDDRIAFSGTCVSNGGAVSFVNIGRSIEIREQESTNILDIYLETPSTGQTYISRNETTGKTVPTIRKAILTKNAATLASTEYPNRVFKWFDITDENETELTGSTAGISISTDDFTNDTISIDDDAVQSMMLLCCRCYENSSSSTPIASEVIPIFDLSDELQVRWAVYQGVNVHTGTPTMYIGDEDNSQQLQIRSGGAYTFCPIIYNRSTGTAATDSSYTGATWAFGYDDNDGNPIASLTNQPHTSGWYGQTVVYDDVVLTNGATHAKYVRPVHLSATATIA